MRTLKETIYGLVDGFLVEAKDQYGNDRSLDRLNEDRHLFVTSIETLIKEEKKKTIQGIIDAGGFVASDGEKDVEYKLEKVGITTQASWKGKK